MAYIERNKTAVLFLGLPGSGKTTQSSLLAKDHGFLHLTTSRIIRDVFHSVPLGRDPRIDEERQRYDAGKIVDPELVSRWVNNAIERVFHETPGIILDGSPRSLEEAELLFPTLENLFGRTRVFPIHLEVSAETAFERISLRLVCIACEKTYPKTILADSSICTDASCGSMLAQKPLDRPEVFRERLRIFENETREAIDFFEKKHLLRQINGERESDQIFRDIIRTMQDN